MESALLSASTILPLQNKVVCGVLRKWQSSFYGKGVCNGVLVKRSISYAGRRSPLTVSSVLGRKVKKVKKETIVPDPDYRIPVVLLGAAGTLIYTDNLLAAAPIGLLGLLLLFQTTRVRFVFDDEALEVKVGEQLEESGENVFVGGKNRWKYSTFVNWELWWPNFPVLVYFKETQTKPEGQVHFFPVIFNGKQLYDVMVERCGSSKTSSPK
ncbi:PREDICTED: uncharacterized protein LOC109156417 isoform X1 [Ipomoea nil]|uniref:uncharacterized protein LOC109156417 isoform X1 n=1 Tax=Ipomoea nil TaxID=35883 RepID=UPI000901C7C5|nr:PREDICTED: uncharacterized protein LOC109156417 isoform X1 [Ipomoea nil]